MSDAPQPTGPVHGAQDEEGLPPVGHPAWYRRLGVQKFSLRLSAGTIGLIILAFLVLSIIVFPYLLVSGFDKSALNALTPVQRITAMNDLAMTRNAVRTTLVQAIGGALLIVSGGIAWAQVQTARRGQLTDRLTKSVDQLGNGKREVRLGGIYALRQVAESPQYTRAVAEVLLAYLKTASLESGVQASGMPTSPDNAAVAPGDNAAMAPGDNAAMIDSSPTNWADRQAVLRILVTDKLWLRSEAGRLDLSSVSVPFAPLQGAELSGSIMVGAKLPNANLRGAHLDQASMEDIVLERADLTGADLSGARLPRSNLKRARIGLGEAATLQNVQADHANFSGADFSTSDLGFGVFNHADFSGAIMNNAKLRGAKLREAILVGVRFTNADLSRVDFTGATLSGAFFNGADLTDAILRDVIILDKVTVDRETRLGEIDADDWVHAYFSDQLNSPPAGA